VQAPGSPSLWLGSGWVPLVERMFQKVVQAPEFGPEVGGPPEWKPSEEAPRSISVNKIWAAWALQHNR
jgi:hypothetical protein